MCCTSPQVGFNMRKVTKGGVTIKMWDLGGQVSQTKYALCDQLCITFREQQQHWLYGNAAGAVHMNRASTAACCTAPSVQCMNSRRNTIIVWAELVLCYTAAASYLNGCRGVLQLGNIAACSC